MKKRIQDVFLELIQNSKKSDRDIAKKLKISQPTVTRIRKRLEKNVIGAYTAIPVLPEIGIELISFIFGRCETPKKDIRECLEKMTKTSPRILFTASGEGMGKTCIIVGLHHNYRDYTDFLKTLREEVKIYCKGVKVEFDSFLAPTSKDHFLNFK
ncbi:MAG: winged helix-turn-helix transcriptional regulator, partial [Candidatus Aenigmarchaeota archaeon]|nr:winged helix-turn-helix transcriptional regulator [Candidatus Aenigmarchaeota archaeon]